MFITVCHLHLHDFLFYASREMGRLYETEKYLHNYGLTYALGHYAFAFHTFKMANVEYYNFTPQVSSNRVVFGRAKELAPESRFEFFVLSESEIQLPRWIRLGKWMAKARVQVVRRGKAQEKQGTFVVTGALNPLDLALVPNTCNIISMAPVSLITNVYCTGSYYELVPEEQQRGPGVCLPAGMRYRPERGQRKSA